MEKLEKKPDWSFASTSKPEKLTSTALPDAQNISATEIQPGHHPTSDWMSNIPMLNKLTQLDDQRSDVPQINQEQQQQSQFKEVKSNQTKLSNEQRHALADVIGQLLGFFRPLGEFVAGAGYQWLYDNGEPARWLLQVLVPQWNGLERDVERGLPKSTWFEAGRSFGDGAALATGILEIVGGGGAAAGGGTLCVTGAGVGCIAGAPAMAAGVALGVHGAATSSSALKNIAAQLGVVFHSSTNNAGKNNPENGDTGEGSKTWGVDPSMQAPNFLSLLLSQPTQSEF